MIVGLILVKELVLVDEDAGVKVKNLRIRELPFLRCTGVADLTPAAGCAAQGWGSWLVEGWVRWLACV